MKTSIRSFAKINLFLYVTSKRKDGYHNLYTLMTPIDLYDELDLDYSYKRIKVCCDYKGVPEDDSNTAFRAAALFFSSVRKKKLDAEIGVAINIKKQIPPGAGLGGGSSNAAVILRVLNKTFRYPFSTKELMAMGLAIGADVPFFIFGRPAIATGVGEKLEPVTHLKHYHLVICDPGIVSSTPDVYKNIEFQLTANQKYNMKTGLNVPLRGQEFDIQGRLHNDLEKSACDLHPEIRQTKEEMACLLQREVYMTGSGASLFALYSDQVSAQRGKNLLKKEWSQTPKKVFLSSFNTEN